MSELSFDCVVVGAGPGGYVAAIRASQLGLSCAVVEKESLGGVCLNWGCIPTKALLKSATLYNSIGHADRFGISVGQVSFDFAQVMKRSRGVADRMNKGVQFLMKKNKVQVLTGTGVLESAHSVLVTSQDGTTQRVKAGGIILATGARAKTFPNLPVDGERIITYRNALALTEQPKKMLVVGAGAIGIEFGFFFASFGTDVTVVEMMDTILPIEDAEISKLLEKSLTKRRVAIKTKTVVEKLERRGNGVYALLRSGDTTTEWEGDMCLVAVGVQGNVEGIGLEAVGITPEKGAIPVDDYMRTGVPGVYAIGDVAGPPWLAHVASHEGIVAAEHLAGHPTHPVDYTNVPGCTYCDPQVASIGMTEAQAIRAGYDVKVGRFPFTASGKAVASEETEGLVKVIVDREVEEVLGIHILHSEATELIGEGAIIRSHEGIASSVLGTMHAHPTLSEAIMEAMGDALGRAIHI